MNYAIDLEGAPSLVVLGIELWERQSPQGPVWVGVQQPWVVIVTRQAIEPVTNSRGAVYRKKVQGHLAFGLNPKSVGSKVMLDELEASPWVIKSTPDEVFADGDEADEIRACGNVLFQISCDIREIADSIKRFTISCPKARR